METPIENQKKTRSLTKTEIKQTKTYRVVFVSLFIAYFLFLSLLGSCAAQVRPPNKPDVTWIIRGDSLVPVYHPSGWLNNQLDKIRKQQFQNNRADSIRKSKAGLPSDFDYMKIWTM